MFDKRIPPAAWLISACFAAAYTDYALVRHWSFGSSGYDLGFFDQAVWHLSRLERPATTVGGYPTIFADHFHPILLSLAPVYALIPRPETLLVVQSLLLAVSIVPVYLYARLRVGPNAAIAFAVAYGLFWGIQKAAGFDFHEVAFAPLFLALAILALETGRLRLFWASAVALCLVREDLIPVLAMFGVLLAWRGQRGHAVAAVSLSLAWFAAVVGLVIPAFKGQGYAYVSAYRGVTLTSVPRQLVTPPQKLMTVLLWLGPFLFLPLRSPLILLAVPLVLARLLSNLPAHWGTAYHYGAPLAPILAMAAVDGLARLDAVRDNRVIRRVGLTAMVVFCAVLPGRLPLWRVFSIRSYARVVEARTGYEALKTVPADASVAAQDAIVPHLSRRQEIYTLRPETPATDFIITAAGLRPWPFENFGEIERMIETRQRQGYTVVFAQEGWTVLRKP